MPPATTPPACHQRRARQTADWISTSVCHEVPHRQFVFTIPKILRGIFRKRRDLLHLLFKTATDTLLESFRARLNLPDGRLAAVAAVHTFLRENHLARRHSDRHLPLKAPPHHQAEFRDFRKTILDNADRIGIFASEEIYHDSDEIPHFPA
ncbi:MAG: hypothetical protein NTW21_23965 [Verrucomicrobia bacterium]|nr:hypothetical protein [Verrucomicrobiota bacterium]